MANTKKGAKAQKSGEQTPKTIEVQGLVYSFVCTASKQEAQDFEKSYQNNGFKTFIQEEKGDKCSLWISK